VTTNVASERLIAAPVCQTMQQHLHTVDAAESTLYADIFPPAKVHLVQEGVSFLHVLSGPLVPPLTLDRLLQLRFRFSGELEKVRMRMLRVHVVHYGALSIQTVVTVSALVLLVGAMLLCVVDRIRDV